MVVNPVQQNTRSTLEAVFRAIDADSCPRCFNFHIHTVYSDGQLQPEVLMQQAIALGLQGFAITDHHTVGGSQAARAWLNSWQQELKTVTGPTFWTGVEITSELLSTEVHILGYAFDPEHSAIRPYLQGQAPIGAAAAAKSVIGALHDAGGLAVLAHPVRYRRSPADLIPAAAELGIDGIETYYCYTNSPVWQPSPQQTAVVEELGNRYGLLHTCGTDTHGVNLRQRL